jgi:hypothetical protein
MDSLVTMWSQSHRYIIYKPGPEDPDNEFLFLIDTATSCKRIKVRDWTKDPSYQFAIYGGDHLFLANESKI